MCSSHSLPESQLRAFKRDLSSIIGRMGLEMGPLALLLFTIFSECRETGWTVHGVQALFGSPPSPLLAG